MPAWPRSEIRVVEPDDARGMQPVDEIGEPIDLGVQRGDLAARVEEEHLGFALAAGHVDRRGVHIQFGPHALDTHVE